MPPSVTLVLVILQVGAVPGTVGVVLLVVLYLPSQFFIGRVVRNKRAVIAAITDIRIRLCASCLRCVLLLSALSRV